MIFRGAFQHQPCRDSVCWVRCYPWRLSSCEAQSAEEKCSMKDPPPHRSRMNFLGWGDMKCNPVICALLSREGHCAPSCPVWMQTHLFHKKKMSGTLLAFSKQRKRKMKCHVGSLTCLKGEEHGFQQPPGIHSPSSPEGFENLLSTRTEPERVGRFS